MLPQSLISSKMKAGGPLINYKHKMNFTVDSRFSPEEQRTVVRLLMASDGLAQYPFLPVSLASTLVRKGILLTRLTRGRQPTMLAEAGLRRFSTFVQSVTGQPLQCERIQDLLACSHARGVWNFPYSSEKLLGFAFQTAVDPPRWLMAKYTLPGFVELQSDDVVVDCGAFVGGFTVAAARLGATVVAVEPSRTNRRCLHQNIRDMSVRVEAVGLGSAGGEATFHESSTGVDSSFGQPDEGRRTRSYTVPVMTLDELISTLDNPPTFLKLEAEGSEKDILNGMTVHKPSKISVDASPEGQSSGQGPIAHRLESLGYEVRIDRNMLYGRLHG